MRLGHQTGDASRERVFVQRLGHVEVQPGIACGDGAAVHGVRHQGAQQVRGGVKAHVRAAALGIDARRKARSRYQASRINARRQQVGNGPGPVLVLAGVGHRHLLPIGQTQHASIAGLSPAQRIEHGAVQHHGTGAVGQLIHRQHLRFALQQGGVFTEQFFGHAVLLE